ncbi:MAG: hypothetical protein ACXVWU_04090 [Nocardioides sp.]
MCTFTPPAELHVPATDRGTWVARQFVRSELCGHHAAETDIEACVVAAELVSDALRNGGSPVTLTLECWETSLLVKVTDHVTRTVRDDGPRRRLGALLVERLSSDQGLEPRDRGRTAWCLVPTVDAPSPPQVPQQRSPAQDEPAVHLAEVQ